MKFAIFEIPFLHMFVHDFGTKNQATTNQLWGVKTKTRALETLEKQPEQPVNIITRWWFQIFQIFLIFSPTWGNDPI